MLQIHLDKERQTQQKLEEMVKQWRNKIETKAETVVDADDITTVVSKWTGIPVSKMGEKEWNVFLGLKMLDLK